MAYALNRRAAVPAAVLVEVAATVAMVDPAVSVKRVVLVVKARVLRS